MYDDPVVVRLLLRLLFSLNLLSSLIVTLLCHCRPGAQTNGSLPATRAATALQRPQKPKLSPELSVTTTGTARRCRRPLSARTRSARRFTASRHSTSSPHPMSNLASIRRKSDSSFFHNLVLRSLPQSHLSSFVLRLLSIPVPSHIFHCSLSCIAIFGSNVSNSSPRSSPLSLLRRPRTSEVRHRARAAYPCSRACPCCTVISLTGHCDSSRRMDEFLKIAVLRVDGGRSSRSRLV